MKLKSILAVLLVPFNTLLLFFLLAAGKMVIPAWLQVFGRMHPLLLHFPIVLVLVYAALILLVPVSHKQEPWYRQLSEWVLLSAAVTAAITALMGIVLSREPGYDQDALAWHKYTGVFVSVLLYLLYTFQAWLKQQRLLMNASIGAMAIIIIWTGHMGGNITHGDDFVLSPVLPQNNRHIPPFEEAVLYTDLVQPILQAKCMGCHNSSKAKGGLIMETKELLLKGGKDGALWDTTKADLGLLLERIHLPMEQKEHMPPSGKTQLTDDETALLYLWIKNGADFTKKIMELDPSDSLGMLAAKMLKPSPEEEYTFSGAGDEKIAQLSNSNRTITPLAMGSPALAVNFYNKNAYSAKHLEELETLSGQITDLNLDNMPVKDADLKIIGRFKNLRRLNLNFTDITGSTLTELKSLSFLRSLSLSGTPVKQSQLMELTSLPKLRAVYLWNVPISATDVKSLQQRNKNIYYQSGFSGDTVTLRLTPPISENEEQILTKAVPLKFKHYIKGTVIRYTMDDAEPDSLLSPIYDKNVMVEGDVTVKARAFKPGWLGSDVTVRHFFKNTYTPDSAVLLTKPDEKYKGNGGITLVDLDKGDFNFGNGAKWLGYKDNDFSAMLYFSKQPEISSITFSMLKDIGGYIFPPVKLEVWGGNDLKHLAKLADMSPEKPTKETNPKDMQAYKCTIKPAKLKYVKLVAVSVHKLPDWHPGKGTKGWIFIDEVFIN